MHGGWKSLCILCAGGLMVGVSIYSEQSWLQLVGSIVALVGCAGIQNYARGRID